MKNIGRALVALFTLVFFLSPIVALLSQVQFDAFVVMLKKAIFLRAFTSTLVTGLAGAVLAVAIALLTARVFAVYSWRGKRFQRLCILIPFLIPNFVLATAYILTWNPGTGLLNDFFPFPFGLYGRPGLIGLFAVSHMPIAFLLLEDKIRRIDSSLIESAKISGANAWQRFIKIEIPLLTPILVSAGALCFALNLAAFAIPAWIGAPDHVYTLSYKIYQSIQIGGQDGFPQAAGYGIVLFGLVLPTLFVMYLANRNTHRLVGTGKSSRRREEEPSGPSFWIFQGAFSIYQLLFWILPLGFLFTSTLVPPGCLQNDGLACLPKLSLSTYKYVLFTLPETQLAIHGSFVWGFSSAILICAICIFLLVTLSGWLLQIGEAALVLAAAAPGAILALGAIMLYSGKFGLNLYNTAWIVVVAFVFKHANLAFQPLRTGLANISGSLSEAAQLSGASTRQIWFKILLPILQPELVGAFFLVLIPILGELTMSIFLVSPNYRSIATLLFDLQDYADQSSAAALSILLVGTVLALNEITVRLSNGKMGY